MVSTNDHCVDSIAFPSNSTYYRCAFLYYGFLRIKETLQKFQMLYSVHIRTIKVEKLIALFHVYGHWVRRFCQALGYHVKRFCQALGQCLHLNRTCVVAPCSFNRGFPIFDCESC